MIIKRAKVRPWMLKKEILILYFGLRDGRTTLWAKLPALLSVVYLLSPIDLIPDFIPFFGYIDDIVVVPLLLNLAISLLPAEVREESILKASRNHFKLKLVMLLIIILILALVIGLFLMIRHLVGY
jgi:uncharacterized membrane protein YkvA (DUF1232 family)